MRCFRIPKAAPTTPNVCARCGSDFPLVEKPDWPVHMGHLYPLSRFKKTTALGRAIHEACRHSPSKHVCGNCYFDISDSQN